MDNETLDKILDILNNRTLMEPYDDYVVHKQLRKLIGFKGHMKGDRMEIE